MIQFISPLGVAANPSNEMCINDISFAIEVSFFNFEFLYHMVQIMVKASPMSMAQKQNTKLRMINSALDLFHRFGVNGTSVDQVLEKSKTGKSQFTHYFKTKEGMVSSVIQHLHEMIQTGQTPTDTTSSHGVTLKVGFKSISIFKSPLVAKDHVPWEPSAEILPVKTRMPDVMSCNFWSGVGES